MKIQHTAITAGITVVITVLFTDIIDFYRELPKPSIVLTSVGFKGPLKSPLLPVPTRLIALTTGTRWTDPLFPVEEFGHLLEIEQQARENGDRLALAVSAVTKWETQLPAVAHGQATKRYLSLNDVELYPMITEPMILSAMMSAIRSGELSKPPAAINALKAQKTLFYTFDDKTKGILYVHVSNRDVPFHYQDLPADLAAQVRLFAESLARGSRENLEFYSSRFVVTAAQQVQQLKTIRDRLKEFLLPRASLSANVTLRNAGKTSITLQPYFAVRILHPEFQGKLFFMAMDKSHELATGRTPGPGEASQPWTFGKRVLVRPFLPESGSLSYINISPGDMKEVVLVGVEQLGSNVESINKLYDSGRLKCEILGLSVQGKPIKSDATEFGEKNGFDRSKFESKFGLSNGNQCNYLW